MVDAEENSTMVMVEAVWEKDAGRVGVNFWLLTQTKRSTHPYFQNDTTLST